MKRIVLILLASAALVSCKKEYNCLCTDFSGDTYTKVLKKRTRIEAETSCESAVYTLKEICVLE